MVFNSEQDPLNLLIELTPKLAKKRYRQAIYDAWDNKCAYCSECATSLDHIVPRFRSGSNRRNNLVPACRRCNASKASYKLEEWYYQQAFFNQVRMDKIKAWIEQETIDVFWHPAASFSLAS